MAELVAAAAAVKGPAAAALVANGFLTCAARRVAMQTISQPGCVGVYGCLMRRHRRCAGVDRQSVPGSQHPTGTGVPVGFLEMDRLADSHKLWSGAPARHADRLVHSARMPVFTRGVERTESHPAAGRVLQCSTVAHFDSDVGRGCLIENCVQHQLVGLIHFTDCVCRRTVPSLRVSS